MKKVHFAPFELTKVAQKELKNEVKKHEDFSDTFKNEPKSRWVALDTKKEETGEEVVGMNDNNSR